MENKYEYKIKLTNALNDKAEATKVVAEVQKCIDELVVANNELKTAANEALEVASDHEELNASLIRENDALLEALRNMNTVLHAKKDLWSGDEAMKTLMDTMAKYLLNSSTIKRQVMHNESK